MKVEDVLTQANNLADETIDEEILLGYLNDCTAQINTRCHAKYPFYKYPNDLQTEMAIPEQWVRVLYIPFIAGKIKQMDSSQFEYNDMFSQFERGLADFISSYVIPDQYVDTDYYGYTDPNTGEWITYTSDVGATPPWPWVVRW